MIRHVVLFKFRPDMTNDQKHAFSTALSDFYANYSKPLNVCHGPDLELSNGNYEYAISLDFDNSEQFISYSNDPAHLDLIKDHIQGAIIARSAIQFTID